MASLRNQNLSVNEKRARRFEPLENRLMLAAEELKPLLELPETYLEQAVVAQDAGDTFATAARIGEVNGPRSFRGSVGNGDRLDVIQFSVSRDSDFDVRLTRMRADLDLYLFNESGRSLARSVRGGVSNESIDLDLDAGTYFLAIAPWQGSSSSYTLSVDASPLAPPPPVTPPPVDPPVTPPPSTLPSVPYFGGSNEWNLNLISAPESWSAGFTGEGVTVAVIDTGVDLDHRDLISNLWVNTDEIVGNGIDDDGNGFVDDVNGWDFVADDNRPDDTNGHGTHVAGTVAAGNNGFGATGVAPDATIMPVRVLGRNGSGSSFDVAAGIRYAADNGADIINLSLGGGFSSSIRSAIQYAGQLGSVVIAAAGNSGASVPGYPAIFSASMNHVLSVGAHSSSQRIASFSNDVGGSNAVQVDAPGVRVFSTYAGGRYGSLSGTSMAAPHVAGLAALILDANPSLSPAAVRTLIVNGADRTIAASDGLGGINAARSVALALAQAGGGQATVSSSSTSSAESRQGSRGTSQPLTGYFDSPVSASTIDAGYESFATAATQTSAPEAPDRFVATVNGLETEQSFDLAIDELFTGADDSLDELTDLVATAQLVLG